jgi:hypothetical protein
MSSNKKPPNLDFQSGGQLFFPLQKKSQFDAIIVPSI